MRHAILARSKHEASTAIARHGVVIALAVTVAVVWFASSGYRHLVPSDEGRYAEIAREMWFGGDWTTIRYNGLKYFEKPPFQMWMTALAYEAFGVGEWQARLWVAVSGAAGLLATMLAAWRWYGARVAVLTGLVLVAAPTWNLAAHFNSLDMGVSGALACVLAGVLLAQHPLTPSGERRYWMWAAWAAMAIAVLTKGLIGIALPGLVLVTYTLIARDWALWRRLHLWSGSLLLLGITAPWFVSVSWRNPEFLHFFFIHEHWERYTSTVHHRTASWWYFVPQLAVGFVPWIVLSRRIARSVRDDAARGGFRPQLLLGAWVAVIFVFFSLSGSKLPGYIVPVFPALALLAALELDALDATRWRRLLLVTVALLAIGTLALTYLATLGDAKTPNALYREFATWMAVSCALALAGLALAFRWRARSGFARDGFPSIVAYSLTMFAFVTLAGLGHEIFGRRSSGVDLAAPVRAVLTPAMTLYSVRLLDHTLPFYLRRTTVMVENADELEFGTTREPDKWLPTLDEFIRRWSSGPKALAVMTAATQTELLRRHVVMFPVANDERRIVVANFPPKAP